MENNSMLRQTATHLTAKNDSYYSLVIGVAKRAREISDELCEAGHILEEKPVKTSIDEFANGKYVISEAGESAPISANAAAIPSIMGST